MSLSDETGLFPDLSGTISFTKAEWERAERAIERMREAARKRCIITHFPRRKKNGGKKKT